MEPLVCDERASAVTLSPAQSQRIARQLVLPGFSELTQRRLAAARILVIGAGGLGCPCLTALAAAGVGHITLAESDTVDLSNLQRQTLYGVDDVGKDKAAVAADRLHSLNPELTIDTPGRLHAGNAVALCEKHDLVIDGCDNFATRYLVADAAEITATPVVWGAVYRYEGQMSVFGLGDGPVLRDIYPAPPPPNARPSCATAGVLGATTATIGSLMASEAIKLITGLGTSLSGRLLVYRALEASTATYTITPDPRRVPVTALDNDGVRHLRADQLEDYLRQPGHVTVDVRQPEEVTKATTLVAAGGRLHVPSCILIKKGLEALTDSLPTDTTDVLFYCASGVRSANVAEALAQQAEARSLTVSTLDGGVKPATS